MTLYSAEKPVESSIPLRNEAEKTTSTSSATLLLCLTLFVKRSYTAAELLINICIKSRQSWVPKSARLSTASWR